MNKKIILIVLVIMLIPNNSFAETYTKYSDYYETTNPIEETPNIEVKKERRYRFYDIEKEYDNTVYFIKHQTDEYPYEEIYYNFNLVKSNKKPRDKEIEMERFSTSYLEYEKVRYLMISDIQSSGFIAINEIEVFYKGEKVNYEVNCNENCDLFKEKIKNGIYYGEQNWINEQNEISIDLGKNLNPYDIEIVFYVENLNIDSGNFLLSINNTNSKYDRYFQTYINIIGKDEKHITLDQMEHSNRFEMQIKKYNGRLDFINYGMITGINEEYYYYENQYRYYRLVKKYVDGYYTELPGLIKDEENYIDYYIYRYKEEIELEPEIIIKEVEVPVEVIKEVEVPVEVIKEVEVPVEIIKEVEVPVEIIKEVQVPKEVIKEVEVPKEIIKEVEVPVEVIKEVEVPKEVIKEVEIPKEIIKEVQVPKEVIKEVEVPKKVSKGLYGIQYILYLFLGIILKKMSYFN